MNVLPSSLSSALTVELVTPAAQIWCQVSGVSLFCRLGNIADSFSILLIPVTQVLDNESLVVLNVHGSLCFAPSCVAIYKGMIGMKLDDPTCKKCSWDDCIRAFDLIFLMSFCFYSSSFLDSHRNTSPKHTGACFGSQY